VLAYVPTLDLTIAADLTESLWEGGRFDAVAALFEKVEELALRA
jgi:hypothetical protein